MEFDDVSDHPAPPLVALPLETEGRIVFPAHGRFAGTELRVSDGTQRGTRPIVEIARGPLPSRPGQPVRFGNKLLVPAETHVTGRELWSIDLAAVTDNVPLDLTCPTDVNASTSDPAGRSCPSRRLRTTGSATSASRASRRPASKFPVGTTQVQVRAMDAFGNARTLHLLGVGASLVVPHAGLDAETFRREERAQRDRSGFAAIARARRSSLLALVRRRAVSSTGSSPRPARHGHRRMSTEAG